jgi:hypothetical protein
MVAHAGGCFRGEEVARRCLEEVQRRVVVHHGRVRNVDDDVSALERFGQSVPGKRVDSRVRRRRECVVAVLAQLVDEFRADESGPTNDDDLHLSPFVSRVPTRPAAPIGSCVLGEDRGSGCAIESAETPAESRVASNG